MLKFFFIELTEMQNIFFSNNKKKKKKKKINK